MKYRRILLKAAAVVTAVSVALSGEGAAFSAVYAADGRAAGAAASSVFGTADRNTLEKHRGGGKTAPANSLFCGYLTPFYNSYNVWELLAHMDPVTDNFIMTADAGNPSDSGKTESADGTVDSDDPKTPENGDGSDNPDDPKTPENPEDPKTPENPDDPEDSEDPKTPEDPDDPKTPENPDDPDDPDLPEDPVQPVLPEEPDTVSGNDLSDGKEKEEGGISLLADGEYGTVTASGECGDMGGNLIWTYYAEAETETLVISRTEGSSSGRMKNYESWESRLWSNHSPTRLVVEEGVESIGKNAFYNCTSLKGTIRLPSTLTEIGERAFFCDYTDSNISNITEIIFETGAGAARTLQLGNNAFFNCNGLTAIHFPDNLTELTANSNAYSYCSSLKVVRIPGSLKKITTAMGFQGMTNVEKIIVEEGIEEIQTGSLPRNTLKEIELPATLTQISDSLFENASSLEKVYPTGTAPEAGVAVKLPEGIKTIGVKAFNNCNSLGNSLEGGTIILPSTLTQIGDQAFSCGNNDVNTKEIIFKTGAGDSRTLHLGEGAFSRRAGLTAIRFPKNLTELTAESNTYSNCTELKEVQIPGSLKIITTDMGFQWMTNVETIIVEEGIEEIKKGSLPKNNLKEVRLPSSLTQIADSLFVNASSLEKVYPTGTAPEAGVAVKLPKGVTAIGEYAFSNCKSLAGTIRLPSTLTQIGYRAFYCDSADNNTTEIIFEAGAGESRSLQLGQLAFFNRAGLTAIRFPDDVTELTVGMSAYSNCTALSEIRFPDKLAKLTVEVNAYNNCTELKKVQIPGSLKSITTDMGFQWMTNVETIIVEEGIEEIKTGSLPKNNLKEIQLPHTLEEIADELFSETSYLHKVYPTGEDWEKKVAVKLPEGLKKIGARAFYQCGEIGKYGKIILPSTLEEIGDSAFVKNPYASAAYPDITEVTFAEGREADKSLTLGQSVFGNCSALTVIRFPDDLKELTIKANAFSNCTGLKKIWFPEGLTKLTAPTSAYSNCQSLKEVRIPGSLERITTDMGFQGMYYVEKIIVGEGIKEIQTGSLPKENRHLEEVQLPSTLEEIADQLFSYCYSLKKVYPTGTTPEADVAVKLPEGIKTIGELAFYNCKNLDGRIILPSALTEIKVNAFTNCEKVTGELIIPDGVRSVGRYAFYGCSKLGGPLYLGDGLQKIGQEAFWYCSITELHTGRKPVYIEQSYYEIFNKSISTVWFRCEDDSESITVDGKSVGWSDLFLKISVYSVNKIYIDATVNRLSDQSFWGKYKDVSFVGPNVVTLNGTLFPDAPTPVCMLDGTYYVTEEGALYALDPATGTAALAYCPPGITELYIPLYITATEEMTGEADVRYARSYRVAGVGQHAVMAATDLTTVTAANPQQITLSARAFADCPTLTSVNGVTTQREANALFGINGTPAIKKAFVNTGLDEDSTTSAGQGKPMRTLRYTNPNEGQLTVQLHRMDNYTYSDDAYRVLTGETLSFDIKAEAYGTGNVETRFRIYFEHSDPGFQGINEYNDFINYTWNGETKSTPLKVSYDRVSGCYCIRFSMPAGATTELQWDGHLGQNQVQYLTGTKGGGLTVWGEVSNYTAAGGPDEEEAEDEIFGGFSGNENYMVIDWSTKRNLFSLTLGGRSQQAQVDTGTHRPRYVTQHGMAISAYYEGSHFEKEGEVNNTGKGTDYVTAIGYRYVVTLPEGMTWADEEVFARSAYPVHSGTKQALSVSEDRRTLTFEFKEEQAVGFDPYFASSFNLGYSYLKDSLIVIGENWDYYHVDPDKRIQYECTPTIYYQFSEPYTSKTAIAYETLLPTEAGMIELHRKYDFTKEKGRGRGLPMEISFVAENKGEAAAVLDLQEITDEVVNFNGYLYLSAGQMAETILSGNKYLETAQIEIREAVLYQNNSSYELGRTHTGTDGQESTKIQENLLNTYTEPSPSAKATLTLTVGWPEAAADGDGSAEGSRRPVTVTVSVNNSQQAVIDISETDTEETLGGKIDTALQAAGYWIPTGLYKITWNATNAARTHEVGPYTDTAEKSYLWTIGSYHATVKPDYLQGHSWITSDSLRSMRLFPANGDVPSAKAVFKVKNENNSISDIEELCYDRSYNSSELSMLVNSLDSRTGNQVLVGNNQTQWICPGVILDYQVNYKNGNSIPFGDMPFMQTFDLSQCLLAPVDKNPELADYPKLSEAGYAGKEFRGRDYYMLIPGETVQELEGVWLGGDDPLKDFYVESVSIGSTGTEDENRQTCIRWYEKEIGALSGGDDQRNYRFYTYVLTPVNAGDHPEAKSVVYANNYIKENTYSTRLYAMTSSHYQSESIVKDIIKNPEAAGTAQEETTDDQRNTYLGQGASVTYRLAFNEYWIDDYTLPAGALYDLLPCTYGTFAWKLGDNVQVEYALKERVAQGEAGCQYEKFTPTEADFARIDTVTEPIAGNGAAVEQYRLSFGDFTIPYNRTLYVYVTLTFPKGEVWDSLAEAADVNLYNMLHYGDLSSGVSHMIARPTQAFLKTGVYGTDGDPYGYIYSNSDEENRIVKYYVVIYNHGKGFLYLNPVHIKIPEGFTLIAPPKFSYNGNADWNLGDVSVIDEDPPANSRRMSIGDVKVSYPEENAGEGEREAVLDISISAPWNSYNHDKLVGKQFLWPGQYVAMEVRFETGGYQETADKVDLPAAMPIDDSHHIGRIAQVQGVDAHRSGYVNSNEGTPEFWESNEIAKNRGFTIPEYADSGKWVASEVSLTREKAKPGVIKGAPTKMKVEGEEKPYDPQEGVSLMQPVKWESKLVNGGSNSLTGYRVKDSVQWPYVFDGEVILSSQINPAYDKKFTISRYTKNVTLDGVENAVEETDRGWLEVNGNKVRIAASRDEALAEGSECWAEVFNGARVYFYKEDVFGDNKPGETIDKSAETMEIDLTTDRTYGVGPASYVNGRVIEKSRSLSYWTKFDLSKMNASARTSYANRMVMQPLQPYTKGDVCEGIAIDEQGEPVNSDVDNPDGIMDIGYVSVSVGQSTAAWMKVKENRKSGDEEQGPEVSDNIKDVLTKENKILIGATDNTVTYTMHVLNYVAGDPDDTVQSAQDRRYSIEKMVIINTLPHEGDKMPFNSKVPRNSDYEIIADSDTFGISLFAYDALPGGETETDIPENRLQIIPEEYYQILYSESNEVSSTDWEFNENSGTNWNASRPEKLSADWKTADEIEDFANIRSIRIEIKDPNTVYDSANPQAFHSLMKAGRTIVVRYQAKVKVETDEDGVETPTPGECAWNSFGYRFQRFAEGSVPMEASSIRTGVQIPSIPILYERLIDYDQNPYKNPGDLEKFVFTIDKQEGEREDGSERTAQQLRFSVTVDTGKSENYRELRNIKNNPEITLWNGDGEENFEWDGTAFWEDGASYVVKQVGAPDTLPLFSIKVNGQLTTSFVYDALYEPVIVVTNQSRVWGSQLYKMDSESKGWDPTVDADRVHIHFLPDALFGLYTTDIGQQAGDDKIEEMTGSRYKPLLKKMKEITYGEGDTAVKLYLKDFAVTDTKGEIRWLNLEDDVYYVRELDAPLGYRLDETVHRISRKNAVLSVYDEPGILFPITGGLGTQPFYITGAVMLAVGGILGERRGRRRKKKGKSKNAGRRAAAIGAAGGTVTLVMAVKILVRVVQIRREKRGIRAEKRAHIRACKRTFRRRKREILRQRRKAGRQAQ